MDFTSIEFYTIAFCVAMGLVGFFLTQKRIKPAISRINALEIEPGTEDDDSTSPGTLRFSANDNGTVTIERTGKKGKASSLGGRDRSYRGHVDVDYIPADGKYYVRYDSSVTGQWCKFSFKNTPRNFVEREMRY